MDTKLKVISLEVKDVLGVKEFALEPGQVTVLSGRNGTGKTSAIEAIKTVFGGGNLSKLTRIDPSIDDADIEPEIVLTMDSEDGQRFLVNKNSKGTKVKAQVGDSAGFEDLPQPQRFLKGLYDDKLSNPIEFLNAPEKERVIMLLGALPVELDRESLWKSMGIKKSDISPVPEGLHPLQELALIREAIFRERTGVNRDAKQKEATAEQTRRATPAVLPESHENEIQKMDEEISQRDTQITERIEKAKSKCQLGCSEARRIAEFKVNKETERHERWAADKRAEVERLIAEDREETLQIISKHEEEEREIKAAFEKEKTSELEDAFMEQSAIESAKVKLAELREQAKVAIKAKALQEQADQFDIEAEELKERSRILTDAIKALDARRRAMADNIPIPGLEVSGKVITVDGIPFDQLNTAKKMEIAVKITCLRAKDRNLPIIWVDGAEALDDENFKLLVESIKAEGVQALIGRVENTEFTSTNLVD